MSDTPKKFPLLKIESAIYEPLFLDRVFELEKEVAELKAKDLYRELAAAQADAERWRQFLRNPYAAWDRIRAELDVDSPAYWSKQANAGIDSFKECGE